MLTSDSQQAVRRSFGRTSPPDSTDSPSCPPLPGNRQRRRGRAAGGRMRQAARRVVRGAVTVGLAGAVTFGLGAGPANAYDPDALGKTTSFYYGVGTVGDIGVPGYQGVFSQTVWRARGTTHVYRIAWSNFRPGGIGTMRVDMRAFDRDGRAYWSSQGAAVYGSPTSYTGNRAVDLYLRPQGQVCSTLRRLANGGAWVDVVTTCKRIN